jgi:hypothetical protein
MLRFALVALLATSACRLSLEDEGGGGDDGVNPPQQCMVVTTNPACVEAEASATMVPDVAATLPWIEQNIFNPNCGGASCHGTPAGGGNPTGRLVLTTASHDKLVNADATFAVGRKLVVPGDVPKSYLMVIMRYLSLDEADPSPAPEPTGGRYMPLGSPAICCQKLDAMARWIMAGAPP